MSICQKHMIKLKKQLRKTRSHRIDNPSSKQEKHTREKNNLQILSCLSQDTAGLIFEFCGLKDTLNFQSTCTLTKGWVTKWLKEPRNADLIRILPKVQNRTKWSPDWMINRRVFRLLSCTETYYYNNRLQNIGYILKTPPCDQFLVEELLKDYIPDWFDKKILSHNIRDVKHDSVHPNVVWILMAHNIYPYPVGSLLHHDFDQEIIKLQNAQGDANRCLMRFLFRSFYDWGLELMQKIPNYKDIIRNNVDQFMEDCLATGNIPGMSYLLQEFSSQISIRPNRWWKIVTDNKRIISARFLLDLKIVPSIHIVYYECIRKNKAFKHLFHKAGLLVGFNENL